MIVDQDVVASCWKIFNSFSITKIIVMATAKLFHFASPSLVMNCTRFSLAPCSLFETNHIKDDRVKVYRIWSCDQPRLCFLLCIISEKIFVAIIASYVNLFAMVASSMVQKKHESMKAGIFYCLYIHLHLNHLINNP